MQQPASEVSVQVRPIRPSKIASGRQGGVAGVGKGSLVADTGPGVVYWRPTVASGMNAHDRSEALQERLHSKER